MLHTDDANFTRIAAAIDFIRDNFQRQPSLDDIAAAIHVSPFHFQRIFSEWAGTSPKRFLQYISLQHAKQLLQEKRATITSAAHETGLSGSGRLHDLFINIEGMTPATFKNGGSGLRINFDFADTLFGNILIATTAKGVCYLAFYKEADSALADLTAQFPNARFVGQSDDIQQQVLSIFRQRAVTLGEIKLHLKGTPFQLKVWEALLTIPLGQLVTYGEIARMIQQPAASRAVGTAIGSNLVAYLIPCHRVIQASGHFGGYRWGSSRKTAMIGWESAQVNQQEGLLFD